MCIRERKKLDKGGQAVKKHNNRGRQRRKRKKLAYILMFLGVGIMWYVAAIYGSGRELTWPLIVAIVVGAGIGILGDVIRRREEDEE